MRICGVVPHPAPDLARYLARYPSRRARSGSASIALARIIASSTMPRRRLAGVPAVGDERDVRLELHVAGHVFVPCTISQKRWIDVHVMRWLSPVVGTRALVALGVYTVPALRRHASCQRLLDDQFINREEFGLGRLSALIVLMLASAAVDLGFQLARLLVAPRDSYDEFSLYCWLDALDYAPGLIAWSGTATLPPIRDQYPVLDTRGAIGSRYPVLDTTAEIEVPSGAGVVSVRREASA